MSGFEFRYRLGGGEPTLREFSSGNGGLHKGDVVNFENGTVDLGATGDTALLGAVTVSHPSKSTIQVVVDPDAVYGVEDAHARAKDATLDLDGQSGAQGVAPSVNAELTVVTDCSADEETLVRISIGKHHQLEPRPTGGELNAALAREIVRFHRQHLGRGPTRAQAFYRRNVVVVVLDDTMTTAERSLAAAGNEKAVLKLKSAFQESMRTEFTAIVERLTGRRVVALMSSNHLDPDMAVQVFVLDQPVERERHGQS